VLAAYIASAAVTLGHLAAAADVRSHNLLTPTIMAGSR